MRVSASSFRNFEFSAKRSDVERDPGAVGLKAEDLVAAIQLANVSSGIPGRFDVTGCESFFSDTLYSFRLIFRSVTLLVANNFLPQGNLATEVSIVIRTRHPILHSRARTPLSTFFTQSVFSPYNKSINHVGTDGYFLGSKLA